MCNIIFSVVLSWDCTVNGISVQHQDSEIQKVEETYIWFPVFSMFKFSESYIFYF